MAHLTFINRFLVLVQMQKKLSSNLAILCLFQSYDMINLIIYHYWKIFCLKLDKSICYIGHLEISISVLLVSYDFSFQRWHICLTSIDTKFWKEQINTLFVNLSHWKLHIYVHWNDIFFILAYWFIFGCVNANKSFQTLKKSDSLISRNFFEC